jgi:hypothetical protein
METIFEDIRERDMDFLFIEEFNVNDDFSKYLFKDHILEIKNVVEIFAKHSIVDSHYGETDIYVELSTKNDNIVLLIENKIDAQFQPQQSSRYNIRKENIIKENSKTIVYTILFAPEKYILGHKESNDFDICIAYEKVMEYFRTNDTKRNKYKATIVEMAIAQARRGYNIKEDAIVTKFWKNYWSYLMNNYSNITMKEPIIKPFDADWPLFYFYWLPKKWEIHHKLSRGYIDLQTTLNENEIKKFENINKEISIAKTGKSYSLRIMVPKVDRMKDFYLQINEIALCFEKIKYFEEIKEIIKTICNVV